MKLCSIGMTWRSRFPLRLCDEESQLETLRAQRKTILPSALSAASAFQPITRNLCGSLSALCDLRGANPLARSSVGGTTGLRKVPRRSILAHRFEPLQKRLEEFIAGQRRAVADDDQLAAGSSQSDVHTAGVGEEADFADRV